MRTPAEILETGAAWVTEEELRGLIEQLEASEQDWDRLSRSYDGLHDEHAALKEQLESVSAEAHKRGQDTYAARALLAEGRGAVRRAGFGRPPSELAGWAAAVDAMLGDSYPAIDPYALRCPKCEGLDYPGLSHNPEAPYCSEASVPASGAVGAGTPSGDARAQAEHRVTAPEKSSTYFGGGPTMTVDEYEDGTFTVEEHTPAKERS